MLAGLGWLGVLLRIDAIVSPTGTGLIYLTSGSRILFALSKNGYIPEMFENVSGRARVPVTAIVLTWVVGLVFLLPFPSWAKLVNVVTSGFGDCAAHRWRSGPCDCKSPTCPGTTECPPPAFCRPRRSSRGDADRVLLRLDDVLRR